MNYRYDEDMICNSGKIYMDSSTFMNVESLRLFIEKARPIFNRTNKTIIVTSNVYLELKRHCYSENVEKREKACLALSLIEKYPDLFNIDSIEGKDMMQAFADLELLSQITLNKKSHTQLLITYDRKLGCDAFQLNNQESNHGRRVFVCFVDRYGELQRCECTKIRVYRTRPVEENNSNLLLSDCQTQEDMPIEKKPMANVAARKRSWKTPAALVFGIATGVALDQAITRCIRPMLQSA